MLCIYFIAYLFFYYFMLRLSMEMEMEMEQYLTKKQINKSRLFFGIKIHAILSLVL
jgi:hypothetical protein